MQTKSTLRGNFSFVSQKIKLQNSTGEAIGKLIYIAEPRINHTSSWGAIWQYP